MKQACMDLVGAILGRAPKGKESKALDDAVALQMRLLARKDPEGWAGKSMMQRYTEAAQAAAQQLVNVVKKQQQRTALQIAATDRVNTYLASMPYLKPGDRLRAVSNLLDFNTDRRDGGPGFTSAASTIKAIQNETFGRLIDTWTASHPKFFGLFENQEGTTALIKELWGEDSGSAAAKAGAKAWKQVMGELRDRFNDAGGDVGELDDWHYPQSHGANRIGKAGLEQWMADTLPLLDRTKYIRADGTPQSDGEVRAFLAQAFDSITTDGQNKRDTTRPQGYGLISERGGEHRQIFFKDSQSYLKYQGAYGEQSLWNVLTGHIRSQARNVGLAETLGPNPEQLMGAVNHQALLAEQRAHPELRSKLSNQAQFNDALFDYVAGRQRVVNEKLADRMQAFRNFMTAVKLPKVIITALGDEAGMMATAWSNRVPYGATFMDELRTLTSKADRGVLEHSGVGVESFVGNLNRFGQEEYSAGWTGKLATSVMRMSGAERMWDARRQALGAQLMSYVAKATREHEHFSDLNKADHGVLAEKGIDEKDWQVWKLAEPETFGGRPMITPKSIRDIPDEKLAALGDPTQLRRQAATHLLAHVLEEAGMGAMDTGPRQRVALNRGTDKGTVGGELVRSVLLFKSFAASMMMKHWMRGRSVQGSGLNSKFAYFAAIGLYGTAIAALGNQIRNVIAGKDPDNMASPKFWGAAVLRGGGLGFFGDFFYDEFTQNDNSLAAALGGPLATTAEDIWKLTGAAAVKESEGLPVRNEGGNLVRFAKGNIPFLNLWYTQAAMDHILWNQMQEMASPGYLDRMQAKAEATKGTSWYWKPEENTPERAPDVSLAHVFNTERGAAEVQKVAETVGIE